jgi:hypothetical protein
MNINYLTSEIIPQREQEIKEGKNLGTRQPIYVVLDLQENIIEEHSNYSLPTNYKGVGWEYGYADYDLDSECREFRTSHKGMENPIGITRFFTDRIIAFFLTSKAAHEYLKYQSHNLTNPYVYVFYSGYGNKEMDMLLENK